VKRQRRPVETCKRCGVAVSGPGMPQHERACRRERYVDATPFQAMCYRALLTAHRTKPGEAWLRVADVHPFAAGFGRPDEDAVGAALAALERPIDSDCRSGLVLAAWQNDPKFGPWLGHAAAVSTCLQAGALEWVRRSGLLDTLNEAVRPVHTQPRTP
jgi:hypothetical protein